MAGWAARDVVDHLVTWLPGFLAGDGVVLPPGPSAADDPVAAWRHHADAVQAVLDDPATGDRTFANPHIGELPLADAIDRFYTTDVFMHTWDLARASGQPVALDEAECATLLAGMEPLDELLRSSASTARGCRCPTTPPRMDRLVGFIGRDPAWQPEPTRAARLSDGSEQLAAVRRVGARPAHGHRRGPGGVRQDVDDDVAGRVAQRVPAGRRRAGRAARARRAAPAQNVSPAAIVSATTTGTAATSTSCAAVTQVAPSGPRVTTTARGAEARAAASHRRPGRPRRRARSGPRRRP